MTSIIDDTTQTVWDNFNLFASSTESAKEETIIFQGLIPVWLNGNLYRNGAGANEINGDPRTGVKHAFDGFAFVQKYNINGSSQTIRFLTTFIKSHTYTNSLKNGRLVSRQFGTDPCKTIFGRFQTIFLRRDPTNYSDDTSITIQMVNNELLALTETSTANILNSDTLERVGPLTTLPYRDVVDSEIVSLSTAHIMYDQQRKMTIGYSARLTHKQHWLDVIFIYDDDAAGKPEGRGTFEKIDNRLSARDDDDEAIDELIADNGRFIHLISGMTDRAKDYNHRIRLNTKAFRFPFQNASYMHSASITEDYLILTEIPLHFNLFYAIWTLCAGDAATKMFKWNGDTMPTLFRVISLDTGEHVAYIAGPAFFTFHHINSYQKPENRKKVIVDICAFDDPRVVDELYLDKLRANIFPSGAGYVRRFELDLDANTCTEPNINARSPQGHHPVSHANSLVPVQFELPRINPKFTGKPYRYVYCVRSPPGRVFDALVKLDVESKNEAAVWDIPCTSPSEPIFVPKPDASDDEEDDGVVLSVVLEQRTKRSFLLILDAKTFKELARAYLPVHIPLSFHGNFYFA